jgi:hypothetical protein
VAATEASASLACDLPSIMTILEQYLENLQGAVVEWMKKQTPT